MVRTIIELGIIFLSFISTIGTAAAFGFERLGWEWIILSFAIFALSGFIYVVDLKQQNKQLKNDKPIIKYQLFKDSLIGIMGIDISNSGEEGKFRVQIEALEYFDDYIPPGWQRYEGYWEGWGGHQGAAEDTRFILNHGDNKRIVLAKQEIHDRTSSTELSLYKLTAAGFENRSLGSYIITPKSGEIPWVCLRASISSSPSPIGGPIFINLKVNAEEGISILA